MPEHTDNQIADVRVLQSHCGALGAELVVIGAIAHQVHVSSGVPAHGTY
jgi:hypothetical protein